LRRRFDGSRLYWKWPEKICADGAQQSRKILDSCDVEEIIRIMTDPGEEGHRRRQSTPFAGILTAEERRSVRDDHGLCDFATLMARFESFRAGVFANAVSDRLANLAQHLRRWKREDLIPVIPASE